MPEMNVNEAFLARHWAGETPVDIQGLSQHANLVFQQMTFEDHSLVGTLHYDGSKWIGTLSTKSSLMVKRFTAAHQLGLILHGVESTKTYVQYPSSFGTVDTSVEGRANGAAIDLLIPTKALQFAIVNKNMHLAQLCSAFAVSEAAMAKKLEITGIATQLVHENLSI